MKKSEQLPPGTMRISKFQSIADEWERENAQLRAMLLELTDAADGLCRRWSSEPNYDIDRLAELLVRIRENTQHLR